jgi:hypothetical protein
MEQNRSTAAPTGRSLQQLKWRARGALLSGCAVILVASAAFDWLEIKTQRLYPDQGAVGGEQGGRILQRFVERGDRITPAIVSSANSRLSFPLRLLLPHKLLFTAVPQRPCVFELNLTSHGRKRQLLSKTIAESSSHSLWLTPVDGSLEFVSHGKITWLDPRVCRSFFLWPLYIFVLVALAATVWRSRRSIGFSSRAANWLTLAASVAICLALVEFLLRSAASKLPAAVLAMRHDLGLISWEPDWVDSHRYQRRHRPNSKTVYEWRFGDIVAHGVIASTAAPGLLHRFPVQIDAEGFRNPAVRATIDVAALGDSFTDALILPVDQAWPAQLEKLTGWSVQNYGTAGYGPQQELYVLQDYAITHRPRLVALAFFAGNDLVGAENFDWWQRFGQPRGDIRLGQVLAEGKIVGSFRNYETFYLWSIAKVAVLTIWHKNGRPPVSQPPALDSAAQGYFAEGMFHIPAHGHTLDFAWVSSHLFGLSASRSQLEQSSGWTLASNTLHEMNSTCAQNSARFVLMFVPSKPEVYWPLTERSIPRTELDKALDFYFAAWNQLRQSNRRRLARGVSRLPYDKAQVTADAIHNNRLAQNQLLADFCTSEKIPMLDLTTALQEKAESGTAVYFPDDVHWNATGHEVAAKELARFLQNLR